MIDAFTSAAGDRPHGLLSRSGRTSTTVDDVRPESDAETYRRLAPELVRFATVLVGPDDAPDMVSVAVTKALAGRSWRHVENRRAYLYRAVLNTARRHVRRSRLRPEREQRSAGANHWELPALRPDVRTAVLELSVRQRAVIVLTYWADLDPAAIADWLGISEGSVRRHLARARAQLRKVLTDD